MRNPKIILLLIIVLNFTACGPVLMEDNSTTIYSSVNTGNAQLYLNCNNNFWLRTKINLNLTNEFGRWWLEGDTLNLKFQSLDDRFSNLSPKPNRKRKYLIKGKNLYSYSKIDKTEYQKTLISFRDNKIPPYYSKKDVRITKRYLRKVMRKSNLKTWKQFTIKTIRKCSN